ncbi:unnamed protein product [Protopolystoma xenopodis]|uniref:Uncharacterized protein n=1 Tax=Protopolystoma xenopodis TaxID=117903 RepID=A0A3S5CUM7_9PLAT|nr:unnamed protein product [Protopolystoma xenopodis]
MRRKRELYGLCAYETADAGWQRCESHDSKEKEGLAVPTPYKLAQGDLRSCVEAVAVLATEGRSCVLANQGYSSAPSVPTIDDPLELCESVILSGVYCLPSGSCPPLSTQMTVYEKRM